MTKSSEPQPIHGLHGADDPGPRNIALDKMNPNILTPPTTDNGGMPNLNWAYHITGSSFQSKPIVSTVFYKIPHGRRQKTCLNTLQPA